MNLQEGFYVYTNYNIIDGIKYQTIKAIFECRDNKIIISCCSEDDDEYESPFVLYQGKELELIDSIDDIEIYNFLDLSCPRYGLIGDLKDIKKELIKLDLNCGETYNQIYRPLLNYKMIRHCADDLHDEKPRRDCYLDLAIDDQEYYNRLNQLEILIDDLYSVFKVVVPHPDNWDVYGHEIRNIIILACSEVDSMMKNILEKNMMTKKGLFFNINDYIQLLNPLRLVEYTLSFNRYALLGNFSPFLKWDIKEPTKSLEWYTAYNQIKHDRENNFTSANLKMAINSIMAYAILLIAQYGYRNSLWNEKLAKVICIKQEPSWDIRDVYVPRREFDNQYIKCVFHFRHKA